MDQNAKQQIIDRLREANNVLVTVSTNPSVDQLSSCIGLTLLLNKLGKHGTAVFSGEIPSTLEFLKPEETIEKNTDSLRDFIIALDKSKADKLRYKVEDKIVKIFITPYRTSISDADLEFSQGDFNVDVVVALGVHERTDLDKAIMAHGRILHDATVISINNRDQSTIGAINWVETGASSLAEMLVGLAHGLTSDALDAQMATAFMTGIVAETDRFSNDKTNPIAMNMASELMTAGANQQLIASKLEAVGNAPATSTKKSSDDDSETDEDGALRISHDDKDKKDQTDEDATPPAMLPTVVDDTNEDEEPEDIEEEPVAAPAVPFVPPTPAGAAADLAPPTPQISKLHEGQLPDAPPAPAKQPDLPTNTNMALEPPTLGGTLTANAEPDDLKLDPSTDPFTNAAAGATSPLLNRSSTKPDTAPAPFEPLAPTDGKAVINSETLSKIEEDVNSPHVEKTDAATEPAGTVDSARDAVSDAINASTEDQPLPPVASLGAQPLGDGLHEPQAPAEPLPFTPTSAPSEVTPPAPAPPYVPPEPKVITSAAGNLDDDIFSGTNAAPAPASVAPDAFTPTPVPPQPAPQPPMPQEPSFSASPQLVPNTPPIDTTAAPASPAAPPPVPPPMMPPTPGNFGTPGI